MKTIAFATQKGGQAKTTTTAQTAAGLSAKGYKVLVIDADPQGNLTSLYDLDGWTPEDAEHSIYGLMRGDCTVTDAIRQTQYGFDLIPAVIDLAGADLEFSQTGREHKLKRALMPVQKDYDVCLIDCPPSLGVLTVNALTAADAVVIPVSPDAFALSGLQQLHKTIQTVQEFCNPGLKVSGVLLTRMDRTNLSEAVHGILEQSAQILQTKLYKQTIRQAVSIRESQFFRTDLLQEATAAADDYKRFVDELESEEMKNE